MDSTELQGNKESETNNQLLNLLGIIYFKSVLKLYKFVLLVPEIHITDIVICIKSFELKITRMYHSKDRKIIDRQICIVKGCRNSVEKGAEYRLSF